MDGQMKCKTRPLVERIKMSSLFYHGYLNDGTGLSIGRATYTQSTPGISCLYSEYM